MKNDAFNASMTLESSVAALQKYTGKKLTLRGKAMRCMLTDEHFVDVLRSGFIPEEELKLRVIAALSFMQLCREQPIETNAQVEKGALDTSKKPFLMRIISVRG